MANEQNGEISRDGSTVTLLTEHRYAQRRSSSHI